MGREGSAPHKWRPEDEAALEAAIDVLTPLMAHYERQMGHGRAWWDAVAGRLAPEVLVTGAACKRRWAILIARREAVAATAAAKAAELLPANAVPPPEDAWTRTVRRVEEYEATVAERTLEATTENAAMLTQIQVSQARIEGMLTRLCRAWDVAA